MFFCFIVPVGKSLMVICHIGTKYNPDDNSCYNFEFKLTISAYTVLLSVYHTFYSIVGMTHIPGRKIYDDNKTLGEGFPNSSLKWFSAQIWYGLASKPVRRNIIYTSNTMLSSVTYEITNDWGSGTRLYWWRNAHQ